MGYLRGVMHGALLGGAVALLYAPKPGREVRRELAQLLEGIRGQVRPVLDQAQEVVESAKPEVKRTLSKAQQRVTRKSTQTVVGSSSADGTALEPEM